MLDGDRPCPSLWTASRLLEDFGTVGQETLRRAGWTPDLPDLLAIQDMHSYKEIRGAMKDKDRAKDVPQPARELLARVAMYREEHEIL